MPKFRDSAGTEWAVSLTVGMLERLAEDADLDLDAWMDKPESLGRTFALAPRTIGRVLWVLCAEEAKARGLDGRAFGMLLDRPTIDAASEAFFEAMVLFYPRSSAGKAIRARLPELLARMDAEIERRTNELLDGELSPTATGSPESSGSTPAG